MYTLNLEAKQNYLTVYIADSRPQSLVVAEYSL